MYIFYVFIYYINVYNFYKVREPKEISHRANYIQWRQANLIIKSITKVGSFKLLDLL